jgi:hypothetical protein
MWLKALLTLIELLPSHPATWPLFKDEGLEQWEDAAAAAAAGASGAGPVGAAPAAAPPSQQQAQPQGAAAATPAAAGASHADQQQQQAHPQPQQAQAQAQAQQALPDSQAADREGVSTHQQGGDGSAQQAGWDWLRAGGVTPLVVGLAGLAMLAYVVLRASSGIGRAPAYSRLQELAARERAPAARRMQQQV